MKLLPNTSIFSLVVSVIAAGAASMVPAIHAGEPVTVTFPSQGSVVVTADYYEASAKKSTPLILLFHRAGSSRGEYRDIAPKLVEVGINCLAVDLRSGNAMNDIANLTAKSAQEARTRHAHPDAFPDLLAAAKYAREHYSTGPILAWGSSYSASLALKLAGDYPGGLSAVLAFSPGEYFEKFGKSSRWTAISASKITVPVFITSAKNEGDMWRSIADAVKPDLRTEFLPTVEQGFHGSQTLFASTPGNEEYWAAVMKFLEPWTKK